jgi:hypothetical protein
MSSSTAELLQRNLLGVFGERDAGRRRSELEAIWSPQGVFIDPDGRSVGFDAIDQRVEELQARFPDFVFRARGAVDVMHEVGRLGWGFGPAGADAAVTGVDVAVAIEGKIVSLYAFIDA